MNQQVTQFTVTRSKWLTGEGSERSKLLRPSDGKMCCLGFLALACGAKEEEVLDIAVPKDTLIKANFIWPCSKQNLFLRKKLNKRF